MPLEKCILLAINTVIKLRSTFEDENCYRKKKSRVRGMERCVEVLVRWLCEKIPFEQRPE